MSIQYTIDDQTAGVLYQVLSNTSITREDVFFLLGQRLFEASRESKTATEDQAGYEFVTITPPDGWHRPSENEEESRPMEYSLSCGESWRAINRGQVGSRNR